MNKIFSLLLFFLLLYPCSFAQMNDFIVDLTLKEKKIEKPFVNLNYDYENSGYVPIKLKPIDEIKSEKDIFEGQIIKFIAPEGVSFGTQIIVRKNQIITAKVETIIPNGMNGIPASIILGDFQTEDSKQKLGNNIEIFGLDLSLLVFPIKWALTPLPPTGSLTNFIKGGHVKIKKNKELTLVHRIK